MTHLFQLRRFAFCTIIGLVCSFTSKAQVQASWYSFTPATSLYQPLAGGNKITFPDPDNGTVTGIPLGFKFTFCDVEYDQVSICTNGWLAFSNTGSNTDWNDPNAGIEPAVMPLFDNLSGGIGVASYLTTGAPGTQVFTAEWNDWTWGAQMKAPIPIVLSFQVKLYEETGRIEFRYREGLDKIVGKVSATIGIINTNSDFLTLDDASAAPPLAKGFNDAINACPVTDQAYIWDPPPACPSILPITVSNHTSTAATFDWAAAAGAVSYDYVVDQSATKKPGAGTTITNTTGTLAVEGGLKPATRYYIHLRSQCSKVSYSKWDTLSFETYPACSNPRPIVIDEIDSASVDFHWPVMVSADFYEYIINDDPATPTSNAGATLQTGNSISIATGLIQGDVYYVHYRSLCAGNDSSAWSLDSFRIPFGCRKPVLKLGNLTADKAIIHWDAVHTAAMYEYVVTKSATTPSFGTTIPANLFQSTALTPATTYNAFVRCNCDYYNMKSKSEWEKIEFTTLFPLSVNGYTAEDNGIAVYPNPATDVLQVSIAGKLTDKSMITIADVTGKELQQVRVTANNSSINTTSLHPGIYLLTYTDGVTTKTLKFTRQ